MKNELVIIGSGGFGREILWLIQEVNANMPSAEERFEIKGFISTSSEKNIKGFPVLGNDDWALENLKPETQIVIAVGNSIIRHKLANLYKSRGFQFPSFIHPSAIIGPSVHLGQGNLICAGSILTCDITVGDHVIINLNVTVGHDSSIGDFTTISPGVNISGEVSIQSDCEIGSGAVLLPGIKLGHKIILGAGAVATKDLDSAGTYIGIPACPMFGKLS